MRQEKETFKKIKAFKLTWLHMEIGKGWDLLVPVLAFWTTPKPEVVLHSQQNYSHFFSTPTQISV